jgi:hypothetical protein
MTTERVNRRHKQKKIIKALREIRDITSPYSISSNTICEVSISLSSDENILNEFVQNQQLELDDFSIPITVTNEEADLLLMELRSQWNEQQFNLLLGNCRTSVLNSIVGPFGLGTLVAKFDKNGGNITTINNAKQKVYARKEDEYNRKEYTDSKNRYNKSFAGGGKKSIGSEFTKSKLNNNQVVDEYTGKIEKGSDTSPDHIVSLSEFHKNGGFIFTSERKADFATDKENLALTRRNINQSMRDEDKLQWAESKKNGRHIANSEYFELDPSLIVEQHQKGNEVAKKHAPSNSDKMQYHGERLVNTGIKEGAKIGYQQSLGLLLTEFFSASFDEIIDSYNNGFSNSLTNPAFFEALRIRLTRISTRIAVRWKDALVAFKDGALSAFLSNLITMLINMLITTGKRIVRVIREGFMSIMKALKMMMFPPEGMTNDEAADAALKLLATGVTVSLGVLAEDVVEKSISAFFAANIPFLAPYAGTVSAVFVGAMTGIASALLVYGLDRLDIFGVNNQRKHEFVLKNLDDLIAQSDNNIDLIYQDEMSRLDNMLIKLQGA